MFLEFISSKQELLKKKVLLISPKFFKKFITLITQTEGGIFLRNKIPDFIFFIFFFLIILVFSKLVFFIYILSKFNLFKNLKEFFILFFSKESNFYNVSFFFASFEACLSILITLNLMVLDKGRHCPIVTISPSFTLKQGEQ